MRAYKVTRGRIMTLTQQSWYLNLTSPAQVTIKMLPDPGYQGSNATPNLHRSSWVTWHPLFPYQNTSLLPYVDC